VAFTVILVVSLGLSVFGATQTAQRHNGRNVRKDATAQCKWCNADGATAKIIV